MGCLWGLVVQVPGVLRVWLQLPLFSSECKLFRPLNSCPPSSFEVLLTCKFKVYKVMI